MVPVVVVKPFRYQGRNVFDGQSIEMEPIDAAVKAREGYISLLHGNTYQTREMVAATTPQQVTVGVVASAVTAPQKRRRRRGRKSRA